MVIPPASLTAKDQGNIIVLWYHISSLGHYEFKFSCIHLYNISHTLCTEFCFVLLNPFSFCAPIVLASYTDTGARRVIAPVSVKLPCRIHVQHWQAWWSIWVWAQWIRQRYNVKLRLTGWAHNQNDTCRYRKITKLSINLGMFCKSIMSVLMI